jgi:hypothetical protein
MFYVVINEFQITKLRHLYEKILLFENNLQQKQIISIKKTIFALQSKKNKG